MNLSSDGANKTISSECLAKDTYTEKFVTHRVVHMRQTM